MEGLPDIGKCTFEIGGFQDFIGSTNISVDRTNHSLVYDTPIDCVWTIRVELNFQIYFQFLEYELEHPNDCNTNYIQVGIYVLVWILYIKLTDLGSLIGNTQCGNLRIFLTLTFYMKLILVI